MRQLIFSFLFLTLLIPDIVLADEVQNKSVNISPFTDNQKLIRNSAIWSFIRRNIEVLNVSNTRITGKYRKAIIFIDFGSSPKIEIGYLEGMKPGKERWLIGIKKDFVHRIIKCSSKTR